MTVPTSLKCPNCATLFCAEDWDMGTGIIKCGSCRSLSNISVSSRKQRSFRYRPRIPMPPGIKIQKFMSGIIITRRWFDLNVFWLLPFSIVWNVVWISWWYSVYLTVGFHWLPAIFLFSTVPLGVGLTYHTLATLFNTTTILADQNSLRIQHRPLPWMRNSEISTNDLSQFYCKARVSRSRYGPYSQFELWAALQNGSSLLLLGTNLTMEQALYLEQKLEQTLSIKDQAMACELPR